MQQHLADYAPPGGTWGFIDANGAIVISAQYDEVRDFKEGLAPVCQGGRWGFIDKSGAKKIDLQFIKAHPIESGVSRVRGSNGKMGLINLAQDTILPFSYDDIFSIQHGHFVVSTNDKKGVVNPKGEIILTPSSESLKILSPTLFARKNADTWEIIDASEKVLHDNIERIKKSNFILIDDAWGYIDANGKILVPLKESYIDAGHTGYVIVRRDDIYGLLNINTKEFKPWTADKITYLGSNRYAMKKKNSYWIYDENRNPMTSKPYNAIYPYTESAAAVEKNDYWGYVDLDGTEFIPPMFPLPWNSREKKIRFFTGRGFGFHSNTGEIVIPPKFADARDFSEGMAAYSK